MYTRIIFILLITITGLSCSKGYLDTKPFTFITVDNLYKNAENAELGLLGCYSALHAACFQGDGGNLTGNPGTDELLTQDGFADVNYSPFGLVNVTPQNATLRANWANLYNAINRTNYLLEKAPGAGVDAERLTEMMAEARFIRGLMYYYLAIQFGGVPLYDKAIHDEKAQRQPLNEVYNFIVADLKYGYENLPHRANILGRANKWSAAGLLAKVYAYFGSCKRNQVGKEFSFSVNSFDWVNETQVNQDLLTLTNDIIENSDYELTERYDYLFRETTKSYQDEEALFTVRSQTNSVSGNHICWVYYLIPPGDILAGGGFGVFKPTGELFFKYDELDTRRAHNLTLFVNRASTSEVIEGVNYFNPEPCLNPLRGDYSVGKFRYRDSQSKTISSGIYWSDGNYPLIRLADIILLNAEARFYAGDEVAAREKLKEVRVRSNPDDIDALTLAYQKSNFLEELLDERSRELCFEGWRRTDLIRFGKFMETMQNLSTNLGSHNIVVPRVKDNLFPAYIWYPIPITEIELSPIEQNPGY